MIQNQLGEDMNKIIEDVKLAIVEQERLAARFIDFCNQYKNFEYESTGINMEDADDIKRKANKIASKMFAEINANAQNFQLEIADMDCLRTKIEFLIKPSEAEETMLVVIIFDNDGFEIHLPRQEVKQEENSVAQEEAIVEEKNETE